MGTRLSLLLLLLSVLFVSCSALRRTPANTRRQSQRNRSFLSQISRTAAQQKQAQKEEDDNGYLPPSRNTIDVPCGINVPSTNFDKEEVHLGEYPWMALLGYTSKKRPDRTVYNCGGTLINDRYVLTAAHCVSRLPRSVSVTSVRLGEHNITSEQDCAMELGGRVCTTGTQDYGIEEIISHPEHHKPDKYKNDIALVRLDRPVDRNTYVRPICLPFDSSLRRRGQPTTLTMVGFGAVRGKNDAVRELVVPVVSNVKCGKVFRKYRAMIGDQQICAGGEKGRGACSGDAGGPLMHTGRDPSEPTYLVGVVSFGPARCGTANVPDVYTKVDRYKNWITSNMHN